MPNIEIHGCGSFSESSTDEVEDLIWQALSSTPYIERVVVERIPSIVRNRDGEPQPYLRIVTPDHELAEDIERCVTSLLMDMAVMFIDHFTSKEVELNRRLKADTSS